MNLFQTIILGIVEGFSEFLPISSTGHLILVSKLLKIETSEFLKSFEIIIQLGAILAVPALYWKKIINNKQVWLKLGVAFIPTAIIGFALYKIIKQVFLESESLVVYSLFIGGVTLVAFEIWHKQRNIKTAKNVEKISFKDSALIGTVQSLAMIPGVSRSAATIIGGILAGVSREAIVEFSFLLAIPTMMAATGYDLLKNANSFSLNQFNLLLVGFIVSFITALLSIKWLLNFVKKHSFIAFGIYRIIVALVFWVLIL